MGAYHCIYLFEVFLSDIGWDPMEYINKCFCCKGSQDLIVGISQLYKSL